MKKRLGSPVLWGLVQAFIAGGFYFSLGLVAERAQGWTWVVYIVAALFFVLTALSYMEGASLHQERGGVTIIARYAFNELVSFIAGWAIMLDYVILIALTAFTITDYLAVVWHPIGHGALELGVTAAAILGAAAINVRGLDPKRFMRFFYFALVDLGVQVFLVVIGVIVLFDPHVVTHPERFGGPVDLKDLAFAFPLAIVAFTALDASSGFAGQVAVGRMGLKRLLSARFLSVLVAYFGLAVVAASTVGAGIGPGSRTDAPVLGVIEEIHQGGLREALRLVVGLSATMVLFTACVGSMLGLSRLGYALAVNRQIPSRVGRLHPRFKTPTVVIGLGTILALALVGPEDNEFLGAIYAFGATLAFVIVHLSVLVLRRREPDRDRPFRIPFAVAGLPVSAIAGAVMSVAAFVAVLALHGAARWVGPLWMLLGIVLYVVYRAGSEKSLTKRLTVPEETLTREGGPRAEYGSILVPVFGNQLDEDIMQTAGRLAAEEPFDEDEDGGGGAAIEAVWVMVIPMSLPIDGRVPDADVKHARQMLKHAKAVGEEYEGVVVNPFIVRARSVGEAIVREARRRGVEAIVMPAEEPSRIRGGLVLGGKEGLRSTFVGETTRYVLNKAPCRVILTAPPSKDPRKVRERPGAPPPAGDPVRRAADRLRRRAQPVRR